MPSSSSCQNGLQGAKDAQGDERAGQGTRGAAVLPEAYPTSGSSSGETGEQTAARIQERLKRVEGEIALWRRRHSICDPTNVWDLRQLEAERRHWEQMLQALKLNRGGSQ
jgi:hypothetical protein